MRRCSPLLTGAVACGAATLALLGLAAVTASARGLAVEGAGAVITAVTAVACVTTRARRADDRRFDVLITLVTAAREDRSVLITTLAALVPGQRAAAPTAPMRRVQ
jgi:hypothetical protein